MATRQNNTEAVMTMHKLAKRQWQEEYGGFIHQKEVWQKTALISLSLNIVAVLGVIYIGAQNKLVPYVIEVDKLGRTASVQRADVAAAPNAAVIKSQLAQWVENARSVYLDVPAQKRAVQETYAFINKHGPAFATINDYFTQHEPFKRAQEESVSVQVNSVQPISEKTWRLEWEETHRGRDGRVGIVENQQATVTLAISPPTDEATIMLNPLGVYIDSFNWSQRL